MSAPKLKYAIGNAASTTLSTGMTNTDTATPLTSTTNFQGATVAGEGMVLIDEGNATEENAYSTGVSGGSLTTPLANRGLEGGSAQPHSAGAAVKGTLTIGMWNDLIDAVTNVLVKTTGAVDTTKVTDLTTAQTLTNKTLSAPITNQGILSVSAQAFDGSRQGNVFTRTLAASETFTQSNFATGRTFLVKVKQGSGTSYTVTWWSGITWLTSGAAAPTQTITSNGYTSYGFICTGSNTFDGYLVSTQ